MQTVGKIPSKPGWKDVLIGECDHYRLGISRNFGVSRLHGSYDFVGYALVPLRHTGRRAELDFRKEIYLYTEFLRVVISQRPHKDCLPAYRHKIQFAVAMQIVRVRYASMFDRESAGAHLSRGGRLGCGTGRLLRKAVGLHLAIYRGTHPLHN